jgi:hypothetical protein
LYEDWLKQNEDVEKEGASILTNRSNNQISSSVAAGNEETKTVQAKK